VKQKPKQFTNSYKFKAIVLLSAVVFMSVTMPTASAVQEEEEEKVVICHKGIAIIVGASAVPAHLAHGDSLGTTICRGK
jgi:hypothetical protein